MARIGSCCGGRNRGRGIGGDLDSIAAIRKFISLVDSGATVKSYQREFGWSRNKLQERLAHISMYRRTLMCADKIEKIMEECKTPEDIEATRPELARIRKLMWRDGPLDEV